MTFPVLESTTRGTTNTAGAAHSVILPATVNPGDLLVIRLATQNVDFFIDNITAGFWTALPVSAPGAGVKLYGWYKFADGTEDGLTLLCTSATNTKAAWHIDRFSNVSAIEQGTAATGSSTAPDSPLFNPSWPAEDTYWITCGANAQGNSNPAAPASYAGRIHDGNVVASGVTIYSAYRQLNADSENPGAWGAVIGQWTANTYAVRAKLLQTLQPPRLNTAVTFYAPRTQAVAFAPRLDVGVQFFAPRVASLQTITAPRLDVGVTFYGPAVGSGVMPQRLDVGVTFFPPEVSLPGTLQPPRLEIGVRFFPVLVEGGARVLPKFAVLSFGPFPGAFGDAALYKTPLPGTTLAFEERWHRRGPLGYTDFKPFVASTYEFDSAYVQLNLELDEPVEPIVAINLARMHIDVPDQRDSGESDIPIGGAWVNFARPFNVAPDVVAQVITAVGVTEAPKVTVRTDISTTRFYAICHLGNDTSASVAARIKWVAQGY